MKSEKRTPEFIVYLDGEFVPERNARISILDHGVLHGDSVFDTCICWSGAIFKLDVHLHRLYRSAYAVGIRVPVDVATMKDLVLETVRRNSLREAYVKILVTRGVGDYPTLQPTGCKPSLIIFARPYATSVAEGDELGGQRVRITSVRRIPSQCIDPKIKSANYLSHVMSYLEALSAGAENAIELNLQGNVAEAPGYNIFVVKDGQLHTPGEDILEGITRETVFELAAEADLMCREARLTSYDLYNADEVFFASTSGGIVPIVEVDGKLIGTGGIGPITMLLHEAYLELLRSGVKSVQVYEKLGQ
jgi:branched-chain amino acid aminotransferase